MQITIELQDIESQEALHSLLSKKFGFLDGYGRNVKALIDCWSSLRMPEDNMLNISIGNDEYLFLELTGLTEDKAEFAETIWYAASEVNYLYKSKGYKSAILIEPVMSGR